MTAASAARAPSFRIIGGRWRGRRVRFSPSAGLRVSGDRARESLFNILGQRLDGRSCLDLFAGAGALGLEAASRGASRVECVEQHAATAETLRRTAKMLRAEAVAVHCRRADSFLRACGEKFHLILLDPPFADYTRDAAWCHLLDSVAPRLAADGEVYCESDRHFSPPAGWRVLRRKKTGAVCWQILRR